MLTHDSGDLGSSEGLPDPYENHKNHIRDQDPDATHKDRRVAIYSVLDR